jgi:hypothetical protein
LLVHTPLLLLLCLLTHDFAAIKADGLCASPEASAGSTEPQEEDDDGALEAAKDKRWVHARPQGQQTKNAAVPCFTGGNTTMIIILLYLAIAHW